MKNCIVLLLFVGLIAILGYTLVFAATTEPAKAPLADERAMVKAIQISVADAIASATKQVPGTVIKWSMDKQQKIMYVFDIVPTTGNSITKVNVEVDDGDVFVVGDTNTPASGATQPAKVSPIAEKRALIKSAKISMKDAIGIASKAAKGKAIAGELGTARGVSIYIIEVLPDAPKATATKKVTMEAADGDILSVVDKKAEK